jgi:signal peptidase II
MAELKREKSTARPSSGRAFLKRPPFAPPGLSAQLIFWSLLMGGLALDLWSKQAVFNWLQAQGCNVISIIDGFLQLVTAENAGAVWGIGSGHPQLLVAVSIIALIVVLTFFLFSGTERKSIHIALGFLAAGICGNLYDRIFNNGLVRDFIDIVYWPGKHWPAFNVADAMLCVGVGLIIISSLRESKHPSQHSAKFCSTDKSSQRHVQQHK